MIYLLSACLAIAMGILITRRVRPLLFEPYRLVWLSLPALIASTVTPVLLIRSPDLLWANDRLLLLRLIKLSHALWALFILVILVQVGLQMIRQIRRLHLLHQAQKADRMGSPSSGRLIAVLSVQTIMIMGLLGCLTGLAGHALVLLTNQGYMPLSQSFLDEVTDPVLAEGIRNGAFYLKKLIDDQTSWSWLGQTIRLNRFPWLMPYGCPYISLPEIMLSISLMITLISHFLISRLLDVQSSSSSVSDPPPSKKQQQRR